MTPRPGRVAAAASTLLGLAVLLASPAGAHTRSTSTSTFFFEGDRVRVVFRIPQLELTRLPWGIVVPPNLPAPLAAYLTGALRLEVDGTPCPVVAGPRALAAPPERALLEWELQCPSEGGTRVITSDLLREVAPSHLHFARVRDALGTTERVLTTADSSWTLLASTQEAPARQTGSSIWSYVAVGIDHIATGYDHLVFLLGLLLLARRVREVVTIVTGFTIAHSITLALAALGSLQPEAAAVEALIGLSIGLVAAENGWLLSGRPRAVPLAVVSVLGAMALAAVAGFGRIPATTLAGLALFAFCYFELLERLGAPARLRTAIAFCFGLIHGFGFAGVLTEMALPQGRLLPALLGFNLGVEMGQLAIVALVWPLLEGLARYREGVHRRLVGIGTAAVCGLGVFWMVARAYAA